MDFKKIIFSVLCFCVCLCLSAQENFPVNISDFSPEFSAEIELNQKDTIIMGSFEEFRPEYVLKVSDKKTNKILIEAYLSAFPEYLINEQNEAIANVKELPYGSQSVLIYEDFNFDGKADFAIMNGYYSCYGGPSFDIYLANKKSFQYSESFSVLSNEYCGMFQTEPETKTIHTMTKSGCCWHQFSEFNVVNNEPVPIRIVERSLFGNQGFEEITETTFKNGKEKSTTKLYMDPANYGNDIIFTFQLEKNEKEVVIYRQGDRVNYALLRKDGEVEFFYPEFTYDEFGKELNENFIYTPYKTGLSFTNKDAQYEVYETEKTVGVIVKTKGKTYNLKGIKSTALGSIKLLEHSFTNVTNQ